MSKLGDCSDSVNESLKELKWYTGVEPGQRILIYATSNVSPHFETSIEIAVLLSKLGCDVTYIFAGYKIPGFSYYNKFTRKRFVFSKAAIAELIMPTMLRLNRAFRKHSETGRLQVDLINPRRLKPPRIRYQMPEREIDEVRKLTFKGCKDFGQSIAGSICAIIGKDGVKLDPRLLGIANSLGRAYISSYNIAICIELVCKKKFDYVLVFNGRFPWTRGAEHHFRESGSKILYHERGPSKDRFYVSTVEPQRRVSRQRECRVIWERCGASEEACRIGRSFFEAQRAGSDQNWVSFTSNQTQGLSSRLIREARSRSGSGKVVVYFSSSENELLAIKDFWNKECHKDFEWQNQREAIAYLARACAEFGHQLIIRIHPHMRKKTDIVREEWDSMSFLSDSERNVVMIIPSFSRASSYELIDEADFVVAEGSTIGVEAVYWNKPTILMGHSFYDEIGVTLSKVYTYQELLVSLGGKQSFIVDPDSCLIYGYYMKMHGIRHSIYKPRSLFKGSI